MRKTKIETVYNVSEISVHYNVKVKPKDRLNVRDSESMTRAFMEFFDKETIELNETSYVMLLNNNLDIIGIIKIGVGDDTGTIMNIKKAMQTVILCNAKCMALCHNHPSGKIYPSKCDMEMTKKFCDCAKIINVHLIDHIILSPSGDYYSFKDEGQL